MVVFFDLLRCPERLRVPFASDHGSKAGWTDSTERAGSFGRVTVVRVTGLTVLVERVAKVMWLLSSPLLDVVDVLPGVDWLAVCCDVAANRTRLIGRVRWSCYAQLGLRRRVVLAIGDRPLRRSPSGRCRSA